MSTGRQFAFGVTLVVLGIRLALVFVGRTAPPRHAWAQATPEQISQRETRNAEQRVRLADLLETSVLELDDRAKLDQTRSDAARALRDLGREASSSGATALGFEAFDLERSLAADARRTCSLDALKKLDAASSALTPDARAPLAERLAIVHRHVKATCELATL